MATLIQFRRGTASQWTSANTILHAGELGFETNTGKFKIGDGSTAWNDLGYASVLPATLNDYVLNSALGANSGVATLDSSGKLTLSQLPDLAKVTVHSVANQTARLALSVEPGDIAIQTDTGDTYVLASSPASTNGNWAKITVGDQFPSHTTDNLSEGSTNKYYTSTRARNDVAGDIAAAISGAALGSTDDLSEGTTNLYFTAQRALNATASSYDPYGAAASAQSSAATYTDGKISTEVTNRNNAITSAISSEVTNRNSAITSAISSEVTARDNAISSAISSEVTARNSAIGSALTTAEGYTDSAINSEVTNRNSAIATAKSQAISTSEGYTDTAISNEVTNRNSAITTAKNDAESYADGLISTEVTNRNSAIATAKSQAISSASTYTDTAISNLVNGAPAVLDTLKELADAIADDANFSTTVATHIASAKSDAEAYTDSAISTEVTNRNNAITAATSSNHTYTDNAISTEVTNRNNAITAATSSNHTYTDNAISTEVTNRNNAITAAVSSAESYTDSAISTEVTNRNSAISSHASLTSTHGVTGNIVGTTDAQTLTNKTLGATTATGILTVSNTSNSTSTSSGAVVVSGGIGVAKDLHVGGVGIFGDNPTVTLSNAVAYFDKTADGAVQVGMQNPSTGTSASSDFVATADNGNDTSKYIDLGINNSHYSDSAFSATGANDGYLIVDGGNLVFDVSTGGKSIVFAVGGSQSTDIMGSWNETQLEVKNAFKADGNATVGGTLGVTGTTTLASLNSGDINAVAPDASHPPLQVFGYTSHTANLQEWLNSSNTVLASVDKAGNITAPTFSGTAIGNLSYYGNNNTGSTITKGTPIYLTGVDTNNNPTIAPAVVSDPSKMPAAGFAAQDIPAGTTAQVVFVGQIGGLDTSAFTVGAILYVGTSGLTSTKPTNASYSVQPIGIVELSSATTGRILVNCTGTYAHVPNTISIPGNITTTSGYFTGSGSGITTLNASNLSSGTVPSARLSLTSSDIPSITHSKISDFQTTVFGYTLDQFAAPVDNVAMGGYRITNLGTPTQSGDAANKSYVDALTTGLSIKQAVNYATAAVLPNTPTYANGTADQSQGTGIGATLTGSGSHTLQVDGVNVTNNQRILVKNQATATQTGIYVVTNAGAGGPGGSAWILTRSSDADNSIAGELRPNAYVSVLAGNTNIGTSWVITGTGTATTPAGAIKIGTDSITFSQFNGAASYVAGAGLTLTGLTFDVNTASSDRIVVNADNIDLALVTRTDTSTSAQPSRVVAVTTDSYGRVTGVTTSTQTLASTSTLGVASFDSGDFSVTSGAVSIKSGGVDNVQLANSKVTVGSTDVSLGATVTTFAGLSSVTSTTFSGNLTGNVTGNASTVTNGVYTTDTGTVTNTMLAGSIADSKLNQITTSGKVANSATTATQANTANAIVARDASGNFTANIITAALVGNADTATTATTATNANKVAITDDSATTSAVYVALSTASSGNANIKTSSSKLTYVPSTGVIAATGFSGSGAALTSIPNSALNNSKVTVGTTDISLGASATTLAGLSSVTSTSFVGALTGNASTVTNGVYTTDTGTVTNTMLAGSIADSKLNQITTANKVANSATTATSANTISAIVARDSSGNFSAGTITAALTGNASTATKLAATKNINGVAFDGSADITVTAAAGTLTGTTLNSSVVTSSLTSVGTLANLTTTGDVNVGGALVVTGNLTVNGTTETINSTTVTVSDKNIELGSVTSPTDTTANGGGITLKGATDKTINWVSATTSWTSSENFDLASGKTYKVNGTTVLSSTQVLGKTIGGTSAGDIADISTAQTLTNKTISGSSNTLTNIGNSSLTNSSVTVGTTAISLGNSATTIAGLSSVTSTTFVGALTGNASTATKLATPVNINGTSFDGSASITVTAAASSLTGTALNTSIVTSSLTAVGTIGTGVWQGTAVGLSYGGTGATTQAGAANAVLPAQTSASGKYLTTDGTNVTWGTVNALPTQTGNSGKYLTTDGTNASWAAIVTDPLPQVMMLAGM